MGSGDLALVALGVAVVAVAGATLGRRVAVPYPVFLVLIGLALGLAAPSSEFRLSPDVVFLVFLPPLVFGAGLASSPRELAKNRLPIGMLSVGLVVITAGAVAWTAHVLLDLPFAAAFVLGAAVAPTDPIAAVTVMRRAAVDTSLSVIIEGEGLFNDGVALVLFGVAVDVAVKGHLDLADLGLRVAVGIPGGIAIGLLASWLVTHALPRVADGPAEIAMTLVVPYLAYVPADRIGASGVLAALAAGLHVGTQSPDLHFAEVRLQARSFWEVLDFVLNVALFTLLGLSLPAIARAAPPDTAHLLVAGGAVCLAVVGIRMVWMLTVPSLIGLLGRSHGRPLRERVVLGWAGMRGAVSLAAALAVPPTVGDERTPAVIVYVVIVVIVITLLVQGASLPLLLRAPGGGDPEGRDDREARLELERAALRRLDELREDVAIDREIVERVAEEHIARREQLRRLELDGDGSGESGICSVRRAVVDAQREALRSLRGARTVDEATFRRLQRELDLQETQLR